MIGSGDYKQLVRQMKNSLKSELLPSAGASVTGMLAGALGLPPSLGSALGGTLIRGAQRMIGSGDYNVFDDVQHNSLIKSDVSKSVTFADNGIITIRGKELLFDVYTGPTAGVPIINRYKINPASKTMFPWLSRLAPNYEKFWFDGLFYTYTSTMPDNAGYSGTYGLSVQYNVYSDPYTSKTQFVNSGYGQSANMKEHMVYGVECDPKMGAGGILYVDNKETTPEDETTLGLLNIGVFPSTTTPVNSVIGYLEVNYDIKLMVPRVEEASYLEASFFHYRGYTSAIPATSNLFAGTSFTTRSANKSGVFTNTDYPTGNSLSLGNFAIGSVISVYTCVRLSGDNTISSGNYSVTSQSGLSPMLLFNNNSFNGTAQASSATGHYFGVFQVTNSSPTLTFGGLTYTTVLGASGASADCLVQLISPPNPTVAQV